MSAERVVFLLLMTLKYRFRVSMEKVFFPMLETAGGQERSLFEIVSYIDILFHLLFPLYILQVPKQLTLANTAVDTLFVLTIVTLEFRSSFLSPLPCFFDNMYVW